LADGIGRAKGGRNTKKPVRAGKSPTSVLIGVAAPALPERFVKIEAIAVIDG
jgi:hypothetical protein